MDEKEENKHRFNATNERAQYKYRIHLHRIAQKNKKTNIAALKHIRDYELLTSFAGFEQYNGDVADKYIQDMFI